MRKKILISYICVLVFGIFLLLTGYSFNWRFLNFLLIIVVVLYPIILFLISSIGISFKILAVAMVLGIGGLIRHLVLPFMAFSSNEVTLVEKWYADGYIITLTENLGWSGPPHFKYELSQSRFFYSVHKSIGYAYAGTTLDSSCVVKFSELDTKAVSYIQFDKCLNTIAKVK